MFRTEQFPSGPEFASAELDARKLAPPGTAAFRYQTRPHFSNKPYRFTVQGKVNTTEPNQSYVNIPQIELPAGGYMIEAEKIYIKDGVASTAPTAIVNRGVQMVKIVTDSLAEPDYTSGGATERSADFYVHGGQTFWSNASGGFDVLIKGDVQNTSVGRVFSHANLNFQFEWSLFHPFTSASPCWITFVVYPSPFYNPHM